ncbi:MAG TPA: RNA polymerase sigma-70 factor [Chitinophagaceae bacterium]|nr:RNA polymerase sigma-70 factor [Chitinophagaceae bacterium]
MKPEKIRVLQCQMADFSRQKAFEELYVYFYNKLLPFAISFVKQKEPAEEVVEDVFIQLWKNRKDAKEIKNLKVYLFVAVRNRALNFLKWKNKEILLYFETFPENINTLQTTPESLLMTKEMAEKIDKAIENLPPRCKIIFKMVREEGLKYREVGEILDISPRTVDSQMTIATKRLSAAITIYTTSTSE